MTVQPIVIHGYAIVSDDDKIADATGQVPPSLRNDKDWEQYQAALAHSDLVVFARVSHQNEPETHGVTRVVISRDANGLELRDGVWWWSPAAVAWRDVAAKLLPNGGQVAAPGGQGVFDLFLEIGYDVFHLARASGVTLPDGRLIFSECVNGASAETVLQRHGMQPAERIALDPAHGVEMHIWRRG